MSVQDNASGAQGDTNAAAQENATPEVNPNPQPLMNPEQATPPNPNPEPVKPAEPTQGKREDVVKPEGEKKPSALPKSLMQEASSDKDEGAESDAADPGEVYDLKFPDEVVPDPEAVKVLNRIGKKFGVGNDEAQELAQAATELTQRKLDEQLEYMRKGLDDFCRVNQEQAKAIYGEKTQEVVQEAMRGLDAALRTMPVMDGRKPITAQDIFNDPNVSPIGNVPWFIHLCRIVAQHTTEGKGIRGDSGDMEQIGNGDIGWGKVPARKE